MSVACVSLSVCRASQCIRCGFLAPVFLLSLLAFVKYWFLGISSLSLIIGFLG